MPQLVSSVLGSGAASISGTGIHAQRQAAAGRAGRLSGCRWLTVKMLQSARGAHLPRKQKQTIKKDGGGRPVGRSDAVAEVGELSTPTQHSNGYSKSHTNGYTSDPGASVRIQMPAMPTTPKGGSSKQIFRGSLKAMLLLNVGAALFGSNQVTIKVAEHGLSPNALSAARFAIAAIAFLPAIVEGLKHRKLTHAAMELGMWLFGGYTLQALGLSYTTATRGAFTGTFTVIAVPLLVGLSGRKVSWSTWAAAVVAIAGVGLLTSSGADPNIGDLLCILSAVLFGVHKWRTETITARFEDTTSLIAVQLLVLAGASVLISLPELATYLNHAQSPASIWQDVSSLPWLSLIYMGLATTAFTLWIEMHALKEVSAPLAALIYTAEPLWGALFAWGLLGERWGPTGWFGAALILSASLGAQLVGTGGDGSKVKTRPVYKRPGKLRLKA